VVANKRNSLFFVFFVLFFLLLGIINSKIYDLKLKNELEKYKKLKNLQIQPLSINTFITPIDTKKVNATLCVKEKPEKYLVYDEKNKCYWISKEITLKDLASLEDKTIITTPKKVEPLMFDAIPAISGNLSLYIIDKKLENIDIDSDNEILIKAIPYLNSSLGKKGNVTVAIIDSGISDNIWFSNANIVKLGTYYDIVSGDCVYDYSNYQDEDGHGTHVISLFHSINPYAKIIAIKLINWGSNSIICAIKKAVELNASIISMSLGYFPNFFDCFNDVLCLAVNQYSKNNDTLFVIAAGNAGNDKKHYTANNGDLITLFEGDTSSLFSYLRFKSYNGNPINLTFYNSSGDLIGWIKWNSSLGYYEVYNTSQLSFDFGNDGFIDISDSQSGYSNERNLEVYLGSNVLDKVQIKIETVNNEKVDVFALPFSSSSHDYLSPNDPYATILSPAISPYAISVGSINTKNSYFYFDSLAKIYKKINGEYWLGEVGNISSFSSRGSSLANLTKPNVLAPGAIIFGAYLNYSNYCIVNKTLNINYPPIMVPIIPIYGVNNSYLIPKQGTSMATPIVSGLVSLIKAVLPHGNSSLIKAILYNSTSLNTYLVNLKKEDRGYGLVNYSLIEKNIPKLYLINYFVDYINKKLTLKLNNPTSFPIPYINISLNGSSLITSLNSSLNEITFTLPENIDLTKNYTLLLEGDFLNSPVNYTIHLQAPNITIQNVSYFIELNYSDFGFSIKNLTLNITLNYSSNFIGNVSCLITNMNKEFTMEENTTKTITIPFYLNESNILQIECTNNINNLTYEIQISDLFKENNYLTYKPEINISFWNNISNILQNETLFLKLPNLNTVQLNKGDSFNYTYSLENLTNFNNIADNYSIKIKQGDLEIDNIVISYYSNISLANLSVQELVVDENSSLYIRPLVNLINYSKALPNCNLSYYLNNSMILSKKINYSGLINLNESEFKFFNISFNKTYILNVTLTCTNNYLEKQNKNLTLYYNSSDYEVYLNNDMLFSINQSSFFKNITLTFINLSNLSRIELKVFTKNLVKNFYYNNQTQDFLKTGNNYSLQIEPFDYYKAENYIPLTFNITDLNEKSLNINFSALISLEINQTEVKYFTRSFNFNFTVKKPKINLSFKNDNPYTTKLNYLGKDSLFFINLINNESQNLSLKFNFLENFNLNYTIFSNFGSDENKTLLLINTTPNFGEGSSNLIFLAKDSYYNFTIFKFNQPFYYDLIFPLIENFSVNPSNYFNEENKYYTNGSFNVSFSINDSHFCGESCVDLAINDNVGVVYTITNNTISFTVEKDVLNYGDNYIHLYARDTFGNRINLSFVIVYDNLTPVINILYNNSKFYNRLFIKPIVNEDYLWFIKANNTNGYVNNIYNLTNNELNILPCVLGNNNLVITAFDKASNSNKTNFYGHCYLSITNFNLSSDMPIYALGLKNESSYKIKLTKFKNTTFIQDGFYYTNKTFKLEVDGELTFLALALELEKEGFSFLNYSIYDEDYDLIKTLNYSIPSENSIIPVIYLENINDDEFYISILMRRPLFSFSIEGNNSYYMNNIYLKVKANNVSKILIKNLNNSFEKSYNINNELKALIPCVSGLNKINITAYYSKNESIYYTKSFDFYCLNQSLIETDNPSIVESVVVNESLNQKIVEINDSAIEDFVNDTYWKKQVKIDPLVENVSLMLVLKYEIPSDFSLKNIYLNKSGTLITINTYNLTDGELVIYLNLTNDPNLIIEAEKEETSSEGSNNNAEGSENNNEGSGSSNYGSSSSSSSSSYSSSSSSGGSSYYYNTNEESYSTEEDSNINYLNKTISNSSIIIKGKNNTQIHEVIINDKFINKIKVVVSNTSKEFLVNLTFKEENKTVNEKKFLEIIEFKGNNTLYISLFINKTKLEEKFGKDVIIYTYSNHFKLVNGDLITLRNGEKVVIAKKVEKIEMLTDKNEKENKEVKNKTKKIENSSKENVDNKNESKDEEEKNKSSIIWKVLKYFGIGIILFLLVDFLDFLYKKKKGLI
jgi:hypothetical protein